MGRAIQPADERTHGSPAGAPMLDVHDVAKRFGGLNALDGVTLTIARGDLVGLIGPNGAGKSTLFNVVTGLLAPDRGSVHLDGLDVAGLGMTAIAQAGVARTFQTPRGFASLSAIDNLVVVPSMPEEGLFRAFAPWGRARQRNTRRADEVLDLVGLSRVRDIPYPRLSVGQMRLLEIGRQLMRDPKLLLLDEPTAGTTPAMQESLTGLLRKIRDSGVTVVVVEHNLGFVFPLVSVIYVMDEGKVIAAGQPSDVRRNPVVVAAYLGDEAQ